MSVYGDYINNYRYLFESDNKSILISNFKKKSGKHFKFYDLMDEKAKVYMKRDTKISDNKLKYNLEVFKGCIAVDIENDKYAGYIFITKKDNTISPLWVFEDYRGYGLGEELLIKGINEYNADGLWVYTDNLVAINLYKKYGFKETNYKEKRKSGELVFMDLRYKKEKEN